MGRTRLLHNASGAPSYAEDVRGTPHYAARSRAVRAGADDGRERGRYRGRGADRDGRGTPPAHPAIAAGLDRVARRQVRPARPALGMVVEALDEDVQGDAHGVIYVPRAADRLDYDDITRMRSIHSRLNIADAARALVELHESAGLGGIEATDVNLKHFGKFMLAALTFLSQPRLVEVRGQDERQRAPANRARVARRLAPLGAIREIRILIDEPVMAAGGRGGDGTGERGGTIRYTKSARSGATAWVGSSSSGRTGVAPRSMGTRVAATSSCEMRTVPTGSEILTVSVVC